MLFSVVEVFISDKKNDKTKEFSSETYTRLKYDEKLQYWGKETVSLLFSSKFEIRDLCLKKIISLLIGINPAIKLFSCFDGCCCKYLEVNPKSIFRV